MIFFEQIKSNDQLYNAIMHTFYGDQDLVDKYHIVNGNFENCLNDTFNKIQQTGLKFPMNHYYVMIEKLPVGFISVNFEHNLLYSFGINKAYRNKDFLIEWFSEVKRFLGGHFFTCIAKKNTRAILFLIKNGMKVSREIEVDYFKLEI